MSEPIISYRRISENEFEEKVIYINTILLNKQETELAKLEANLADLEQKIILPTDREEAAEDMRAENARRAEQYPIESDRVARKRQFINDLKAMPIPIGEP